MSARARTVARDAGSELLLRKLMFNISTLEDLGKVLSSSDDFQARLRTALSSIMGCFPAARGGLFFYHRPEGGSGALELVASRGVELAPGMALPFPDALRDAFLSDPRTVFRREPAPFLRAWMEDFGLIFDALRTHLIQPLCFKREFLGLVCLGEKFNGEEVGSADLELLRIMAGYTSVGIHNQNLLVHLEKTNVALRRKVVENSRLYADLQEMYQDTVRALGTAIDAKDPYTAGHSDRVAHFAVAIARQMGLPSEEVNALQIASHLHDIGKIAIDNTILCKPKKLTDTEFKEISRHPCVSYDILSNIRFPYRDVALLTRSHHERLNGGGYPDGKKGAELTTGMKILALADAFDAMTSDRPYRPALSVEEALEEITRFVSIQFDREVTGAFASTLREELEAGCPAQGIISNMGKKCDPARLAPALEQMFLSLH